MIKKFSLFCLVVVFSLVLTGCVTLQVKTPEALKNFKFITMEEMTAMESYPDYYFEAGPAKQLMTIKERGVWGRLNKIEDKKEFLKKFWQRRDPDLTTPENEFKTLFYYNAIYVKKNFNDEHFGYNWNSDRGKFFLVLGAPDAQQKFSRPSLQQQFEQEREAENPSRDRAEEVLVWEYQRLLFVLPDLEQFFPYSFYRPALYFIKGIVKGWEMALADYGEQVFQPIPDRYRAELERFLELMREKYIVNKINFSD